MTCKTFCVLAQALEENPSNLVEFNMGQNFLKDKGGLKFGESLRYNDTLAEVNLCDNGFTDETALAINRSLPINKMVSKLNLTKNLINLRVLDLLDITLDKIRETKIASVLPD